ncbi:hypothetical protein H0H92_006740, partial [Tricholoma furcatifolium]
MGGPLEDERDGTDATAFSKIPEDKPKRKRTRNNRMAEHLKKWLNFRESSLRELLQHESLPNSTKNRKGGMEIFLREVIYTILGYVCNWDMMVGHLTLQAKTTIYDFFKTLMQRMDNSQLEELPTFRIWRHLQALKRDGHAHDVHGASGTSLGELALRLKNRGLSDTELAPGWAYYIEDSAYQKHLKNYVDQPESQELLTLTTSHPQINTCQSEHDAIARANSRHLPGHLVSGTGLVLCARHALICRNGVADLTKGENSFKADRYCTMDYIALMTLVQSSILYWGKNLQTRAAANKIEWTALVPRWHIMVHGDECQTEHLLNYEQGVGCTCGEDVECGWLHTDQLSTSTREMGPANCRETLNDHWGRWNWQKIVGFRPLFRKCLREAVAMQDKHRTVVAKLTQTFSPQKIEEWSRMIEEWKMDRKKPQNEWVKDNPYAEPTKVANLHEVKRELAKEEAEQAAEGVLPLHEKIGPTEFVSLGLELESQHLQNFLEVLEAPEAASASAADLLNSMSMKSAQKKEGELPTGGGSDV